MTSAPSHLPRLNGNKLLILLPVFLMFSCAAQKMSAGQHPEIVPIEAKKATPPSYREDSVTEKPSAFDLDTPLSAPAASGQPVQPATTPSLPTLGKDANAIFNIAVILPFYLDQIPLGMYEDDTTKQLSGESRVALAFYTGCQMAKERYADENLKANVYFIDDQEDSSTTADLFRQKPFPNVDLIIGPLSFNTIRQASELARKYRIPMISPLANSMYIQDNPYYFNAFPSLKTQYTFLLEKAKAKVPDTPLDVIYDGQDSSAENIQILKDIAGNYYGYGQIRYHSMHATDDIAHALAQADTLSDRPVLIYSSKDVYVKAVIAKLKPLKNPLFIFSSAVAKNIVKIADLKYPHSIYTAYPFNTDNPNYNLLSTRYEDKTKRKAEETVAEGYDIMMHALNVLNKRQALQDNTYNYTIDFDNTLGHFQFKPVLNKTGNIDYYDNSALYLFKYSAGNFIIDTP